MMIEQFILLENHSFQRVTSLSSQPKLENIINDSVSRDVIVNNLLNTYHCTSANSNLSSPELNDDSSEIDKYINEFQKRQWNNFNRNMPTNWVDPFEVYD